MHIQLQLLDKKHNDVNNKLPSGLRGFTEISVFLFTRECCDFSRRFIFHLANVPCRKIPRINLKFCNFNQFSNTSYDYESLNEQLIVCPTMWVRLIIMYWSWHFNCFTRLVFVKQWGWKFKLLFIICWFVVISVFWLAFIGACQSSLEFRLLDVVSS